jgi:cytoskeletal protein RodZ
MLQSRRQSSPPTTNWNYCQSKTGHGGCEQSHGIDLAAVGSILRETREERGGSIACAAEALFIKKSTLGDIESGRWEALPHPVYVKGYVKSYASYLGVLENVEAHLCARPETTPEESSESNEGGPARTTRAACKDAPDVGSGRPLMSRIGLICTSVASVLLGLAISSGMQATAIVGLKDVLVACHLAIADVRKIVLP